jgi:transposase-like protein
MSDFKGRYFESVVVLWYRDFEHMMVDRVVTVNRTTIYRWVQ